MKSVSGRGRLLLFTGGEERITLLAASLAQELERRLEQVTGQALEALANPSAIAAEHSALVLVAQVRAGHLVFPWDNRQPQPRDPDNTEPGSRPGRCRA